MEHPSAAAPSPPTPEERPRAPMRARRGAADAVRVRACRDGRVKSVGFRLKKNIRVADARLS